jgi:superfamily II DNA or RNA helicase
VKVDNNGDYKLIFSISEHPQLGAMVHSYVVACSKQGSLTLTYQKVFSGNATHYSRLSPLEHELITCLDDLMEDHIVRMFSPEKKIRPKVYFQKHFTELVHTEIIRPAIEKRITQFLQLLPVDSELLYLADEINPAAYPINVQSDFTKVLFHFHKNENGTNYFVTLKDNDERIPFMKLGGIMLTADPARLIVSGQLYKFYDFVDGNKLAVFLNKKMVHVRPESEKSYYTKFVKPLLATAPVFAKGFEIRTVREQATPLVSLATRGEQVGFNMQIKYGDLAFPFHQDKMYHVTLEWVKNEPVFTKYKVSRIWEANRINALKELGLHLVTGSFFRLEQTDLLSCIQWLRIHNEVLKASHFEVKTALDIPYSIATYKLDYAIADKIDWFDLTVHITIGEFVIPFSKVVSEMKKGNDRITLPNEEIFLFPKEWFALGESLVGHVPTADTFQVKKYQLDILSLVQSNEIKQHLTKLVAIQPERPHLSFQGTLRSYQLDGLSWLLFLWNNRFGGILADDMGLGKTVQTIAFLQRVKFESNTDVDRASSPKFLLVAPTSLLYNWVHECHDFAPNVSTHMHSGAKRYKNAGEFQGIDLIITTYGLIRNDTSLFASMEFDVVILDESQNIKNHTAKTTQSIGLLQAACRVALTGTPVENTIRDIWSQMNVLNKGLLGTLKQFETKFAKPIEKENDEKRAEELRKLIKPFLLRRTKAEVAKELPPMTEKVVYCDMSEEQASYYEEIKSKYRNSILDMVDQTGIDKSKFSILQGLSKLRLIANHPLLIDDQYEGGSGKHEVLLDKISNALADGHKVLVFSQFVRYLNLLEEDIKKRKLPYYILTGSTSKEKRAVYVADFQKAKEPTVFLISLKAGGTGLNLTSADYVFIVDPWWNPAAEAQARDRTHRIGQQRNVFSYKYISRDTIEEKIIELQKRKQGYSKDIIVSENNILTNLDMKELHYLLS